MNTFANKIFWARQINQIRKEGLVAVFRKVTVLVMILLVRILRPLICIRFGYFFQGRIGHFAFDVEYYLIERKLGLHPSRTIDVFFYLNEKPANVYFDKMVKRNLNINKWAGNLFYANLLIPGGKQHKILPAFERNRSRDMNGLFNMIEPQLRFTKKENIEGLSLLRLMGIKEDEKFVCLIVRDSAYLSSEPQHKELNWDYHDFRDSDIDTFGKTALALANKGYWVFRMGKIVHRSFKAKHTRIIDYATSGHRSDFLDIWLMANCFFCISTGTGIDAVADIFRRPVAYVNYDQLTQMVTGSKSITVPKKLYWIKKGRYLTLTEQLKHSYDSTEKYENAKIDVRDLSEEAIQQVVLELEARLTGKWKDSNSDVQLQDRFWQIFKSYSFFDKYHGKIHPESRFGSHFLRNNPEWLN